MTRQDILAIAKPILFNTEMVRAVLDNRKTVTRRVGKQNTNSILSSECRNNLPDVPDSQIIEKLCLSRYEVGDYLYVRETWNKVCVRPTRYLFKTHCPEAEGMIDKLRWRPSIHMPKEVARIFLRVIDIRVERLQDITEEQAIKEGCYHGALLEGGDADCSDIKARGGFIELWDSTIKKIDLDRYGWSANPWVWVIEFERVETDG